MARRQVLRGLAGGLAALVIPAAARARRARPSFEAWLASFRPRALAGGVSPGTYDRVTSGLEPDTRALDDIRSQPGVPRKALAVFEPSCLRLAHRDRQRQVEGPRRAPRAHRARIRRGPGRHARALGHRERVRRPRGPSAITRVPSFRRSPRSRGPSRAAATTGNGSSSTPWSSSSAAGRRPPISAAPGRARWDIPNGCRTSGSRSASTTTGTAGSRRLVLPTTRSARARAISCGAAAIAAASPGAVRCVCRPASAPRPLTELPRVAYAGVERADGAPFARPGVGTPVGAREGGPAFLLEPNFYAVKSYNPSMSYTLALAPLGRPCARRTALRAIVSRQRAGAHPRRGAGDPAPSHDARLRHRRRRRPSRHRHHARGRRLPRRRWGWSRTAMPGYGCSPGYARDHQGGVDVTAMTIR